MLLLSLAFGYKNRKPRLRTGCTGKLDPPEILCWLHAWETMAAEEQRCWDNGSNVTSSALDVLAAVSTRWLSTGTLAPRRNVFGAAWL